MGILQNYIDNGSEYKSLKFGKDQPGGGSSKQPFMQKDINKAEPIQPGLMAFPSVLRGGIYSEVLAATDVVRLTKYFATPNGIQFAVNQNILSRLAPRTEASGVLNEYIYTPLSTLAQAGVGNLGIHLNKQGLDPTGLTDFAIKPYGEVVYENNLDDPNTFVFSNRLVNLLYNINEDVALNFTSNPTILSYSGGPGSMFGVGKTKISYATKPDGVTPLKTIGFSEENPKTYLVPGLDNKMSSFDSTFRKQIAALSTAQSGSVFAITSRVNESGLYSPIQSGSFNPYNNSWVVNTPGTNFISSHKIIEFGDKRDWKTYLTPTSVSYLQSDTKLSIYYPSYKNDIASQTTSSYTSQINQYLKNYNRQLTDNTAFDYTNQTMASSIYPQGYPYSPLGKYSSNDTLYVDLSASDANPGEKATILNSGNYSPDGLKKGYLANLPKSVGYTTVNGRLIYDAGFVAGMGRGIAPDFRGVDRLIRGFDDPTYHYDHITFTSDKVDKRGDYYKNEPEKPNNKILDRIYYTTSNKRQSTPFNPDGDDLIPFRIGILNQTINPISEENISFKAYIDNMSDSYDADWSPQTYMGRGEKLYKYNSFGRSISLGFTVAAEGPHNMKDMYISLNKLASSLAPTYVGSEYMAGNIHKLTIGNYIHELYGIITGFTYDIDNESPWEIGNKYGKDSDKLSYYYNKQLPMLIKVTGFKFTPIHNFRPEYLNTHQFISMGSPEIPNISGQVDPLKYDFIT